MENLDKNLIHKINFLDINISNITTQSFIETVIEYAKDRKKTFITYLNAHCVNKYFEDKEYAAIIDNADIVYADGMGIVYASRYLGSPLPERVNAGDFIVDFCKQCGKEDISLFFLGTKQKNIKRAKKKIKVLAPGVNVAGIRNGFFGKEETEKVINEINAASPDILIVGMGIPNQEKWVYEHFDKIQVPICWCVGALFDYYGGEFKRAPVLMRQLGFEWLFRLLLEPRRMWRRYLVGNFLFIKKVVNYKKKQHYIKSNYEK